MSTTLLLLIRESHSSFFFFFNDTATTEIYTLSLHDALPISRVIDGHLAHRVAFPQEHQRFVDGDTGQPCGESGFPFELRSEEHTSELQSHLNLVCRLLLEKKKKYKKTNLSHASQSTVTSLHL